MKKKPITEALILVATGFAKGASTMLVKFRGFARDTYNEGRLVRVGVLDKAKGFNDGKSFTEYFLRLNRYGLQFHHDRATDDSIDIEHGSGNQYADFFDASKRDRIEKINSRLKEISKEERDLNRELVSYRLNEGDYNSLQLTDVKPEPDERDAEVRKIGYDRVQAKRKKSNGNRRSRAKVAARKKAKSDVTKAKIKTLTAKHVVGMTDAGFDNAWVALLDLRVSRKKTDMKTLLEVLPKGLTALPTDEEYGWCYLEAIENLHKPASFFEKKKLTAENIRL